jgi:zinc transport system substrate-binding protein
MNRHIPRVIFGAAAAVALLLPFIGCKPKPVTSTPPGDGQVNVVVSFPALYCFAANVVGDTGTVRSIKSTQGAHGSEVTQADRELAESADILFINGLGLDDGFAKNLRNTSTSTKLKVVDLGGKLDHALLLESDGTMCVDHDHKDGEKHAHDHGDHDPHVWLGPDQAKRFVELIRRELTDRYPQHAATFTKNASAYTEKLVALKAEGKEKLKTKKSERKIVTVHGSMGYFASAFDVTIAGVVQTTPGKEPSAAELKKLVEACAKEKVRVIATEPQFSTRGAVRVLEESLKGAGIANPVVIELDPLETATKEELKPDWYETKMRANIAAVATVFGQ